MTSPGFTSTAKTLLPGLSLSVVLAGCAFGLSGLSAGLIPDSARSPLSPILLALTLGILVRHTLGLNPRFQPGVQFSSVHVLRAGIVLLGLQLSLLEAGRIGLLALPVVVPCIVLAYVCVRWLARRMDVSRDLGTLLAVGTSICGVTAIVALAPAIRARREDTSYAVTCITLFGLSAMMVYPVLARYVFDGASVQVGVFLGAAVHDTSQVIGAALLYQHYFADPQVLEIATVTKLVRNLSMLVILPAVCLLHARATAAAELQTRAGNRRNSSATAGTPALAGVFPFFILGFVALCVVRSVGDLGTSPFGLFDRQDWHQWLDVSKSLSQYCLCAAMAGVGLETDVRSFRALGYRPLVVGFVSATVVGFCSGAIILAMY
ncbi:YeiH family protein [Elongatibacter sediminis]|uniref:Sulfate exporter family transporter n=1 Tax=Elongatibacter sediminis TaxID=3119006 RepID=A0AAW9RG02_9GAMM